MRTKNVEGHGPNICVDPHVAVGQRACLGASEGSLCFLHAILHSTFVLLPFIFLFLLSHSILCLNLVCHPFDLRRVVVSSSVLSCV